MKLLVGLPRVLLVVGVLVVATAPVFADIVRMDEAGMAAVRGGGYGTKLQYCVHGYMQTGICDPCHAQGSYNVKVTDPVMKAWASDDWNNMWKNICAEPDTEVDAYPPQDTTCTTQPTATTTNERTAYQYSGHP
jgi:hypothetical protein